MSELLDNVVDRLVTNPTPGGIASPYVALPFESPLDVLTAYDPDVTNGEITLYPWQVALLKEIGKDWTAQDPFKFFLAAVNGSGKDRFIVAPTIVWLLISKTEDISVTTSSSGTQLKRQTERYVKRLAENVNRINGKDYITIQERYFKCSRSGSEAIMFATDEAGKAEGYHPNTAKSGLTIFINEVKSMDDAIVTALHRCTGYNRWINVSSPGNASGFFHDGFKLAADNRKLKVDLDMCPELPRAALNDAIVLFGENSAVVKSMRDCAFTSLDITSVITMEDVNACVAKFKIFNPNNWIAKNLPKRAGLDLANGGDENVLAVIHGNRLIALESFFCDDTENTADHLVMLFRKYGLEEHNIWADAGGLGVGILDKLRRKKWLVNRVWFQSPSNDPEHFVNLGAELWFKVARLFQEKLAWIIDDEKLKKQLYTREYKRTGARGRYQLEDKKEAKARGLPSPDRADAYVLAHCGLTIRDFIQIDPPKALSTARRLTPIEQIENMRFGVVDVEENTSRAKRIYGSITKALKGIR